MGRELRVRRDDVDVEDPELAEPMAVKPARLVDIVPEDGVEAVQRLDIEVGVVAQLVREGIARPGQLRGRVEDHDAVVTHHVARDPQERLAVSKDVPSLGRHLESGRWPLTRGPAAISASDRLFANRMNSARGGAARSHQRSAVPRSGCSRRSAHRTSSVRRSVSW